MSRKYDRVHLSDKAASSSGLDDYEGESLRNLQMKRLCSGNWLSERFELKDCASTCL